MDHRLKENLGTTEQSQAQQLIHASEVSQQISNRYLSHIMPVAPFCLPEFLRIYVPLWRYWQSSVFTSGDAGMSVF